VDVRFGYFFFLFLVEIKDGDENVFDWMRILFIFSVKNRNFILW